MGLCGSVWLCVGLCGFVHGSLCASLRRSLHSVSVCVCACMWLSVSVCIRSVCVALSQSVSLCASLCQFVPVCVSVCQCVSVSVCRSICESLSARRSKAMFAVLCSRFGWSRSWARLRMHPLKHHWRASALGCGRQVACRRLRLLWGCRPRPRHGVPMRLQWRSMAPACGAGMRAWMCPAVVSPARSTRTTTIVPKVAEAFLRSLRR